MNNDSTAVASYNGIVFDNNKINIQAAELWSKYNDSQKRELLNKCTHPYVCNYLIDYIAKNSDKLIVIESALLFDLLIAS